MVECAPSVQGYLDASQIGRHVIAPPAPKKVACVKKRKFGIRLGAGPSLSLPAIVLARSLACSIWYIYMRRDDAEKDVYACKCTCVTSTQFPLKYIYIPGKSCNVFLIYIYIYILTKNMAAWQAHIMPGRQKNMPVSQSHNSPSNICPPKSVPWLYKIYTGKKTVCVTGRDCARETGKSACKCTCYNGQTFSHNISARTQVSPGYTQYMYG